MVGIFIAAIGIIIAVLNIFANKNATGKAANMVLTRSIAIAVIFVLIALIQPFSVEMVDAGNQGIKVSKAGDNRGVSKMEYKTGWVVINTWIENLLEFPTFQQHIEYPEQSVITKGGFSATIKPTFNYKLRTGNIGDMYQSLRKDIKTIEQEWLQTAIVGAVNDVANRWNVDDIFNQRERFESDILAEANKRTGRWFQLSQLRTNITPPKALQQSIEQKTQAIQQVQVAENQRRVAIAEGDRLIAVARADSASRVIRASGEAEEIRRKQLTLTPTYVEYLKVQKWNGENSQVVSGNGGGVLVQMGK